MDEKLKHLELIQNVINRLANNSFLIKSWSVALISGLFALATNQLNYKLIYIAYIPVLIFWYLDAYFLYMERNYRVLYDIVRKQSSTDFTMDIREVKVSLFYGLKDAFFSWSLKFFHGALLVVIILATFGCYLFNWLDCK